MPTDVSVRDDGRVVVLGVTFPSIAVAVADLRTLVREIHNPVARLRLLGALVALGGDL